MDLSPPDVQAHLIARPHLHGMGRTRHALNDLTGISQTSVPPVMIDADEFALYVSQVPSLGPVLGRVVSVAGVGLASYASSQALGGLREDYAQARSARTLVEQLQQAPARDTTGAAPIHRVTFKLCQSEARERMVSFVANTLMLPGSLLMDLNLLASPLLLGGIFPQLLPWGAAAMAPAVVFMAAYGVWVAGKAWVDSVASERAFERLASHKSEHPAAIGELMNRTATLYNIDDALVLCGLAQAVGAVAMYLLGPIWLIPLLAGTLGLAFGKYKRAQIAGQWPLTSFIENTLNEGTLAQAHPERAELLGRLARLDSQSASLRTLRKSSSRTAGLRQFFEMPVAPSNTAAIDSTKLLIYNLSQQLSYNGTFGVVAEAVANDKVFKELLPRPSAEGYTLKPDDLLRLVRVEASPDNQGAVPEVAANARPAYDDGRVERLCRIATHEFAPILAHRQLQERALLDATVLASLALEDEGPAPQIQAHAAP